MFEKKVFFMLTKSICIIGAGAYGCALAHVFSKKFDVTIISRSFDTAQAINKFHRHPRIFPCIEFSEKIKCQSDYCNLEKANIILLCTPVSGVRVVCEHLSKLDTIKNVPIILCSKGVEINTEKFTSEIAEEYLSNPILVLSGPSFAEELVNNLPASVSLASKHKALCEELAEILTSSTFILYPNYDVIGTQICGAFKNILAILCGVFYGLNLGKSAIAYLITKALEEMRLLIKNLGGDPNTVDEVCGIGDIILTCTNEMSRNMSFGKFLAQGGTIDVWQGELVEGAYTTKVIPLFQKQNINIPIFHMAYDIIYNNNTAIEVIEKTLFNKLSTKES